MFHKLRGSCNFTKLDLKNEYQQLRLNDDSQEFVTHLPFGISPLPAIFQWSMDKILQGLDQVAYIEDDIVLTWKDDADHLSNLKRVLTRLEEYSLRLQQSKCKFT